MSEAADEHCPSGCPCSTIRASNMPLAVEIWSARGQQRAKGATVQRRYRSSRTKISRGYERTGLNPGPWGFATVVQGSKKQRLHKLSACKAMFSVAGQDLNLRPSGYEGDFTQPADGRRHSCFQWPRILSEARSPPKSTQGSGSPLLFGQDLVKVSVGRSKRRPSPWQRGRRGGLHRHLRRAQERRSPS